MKKRGVFAAWVVILVLFVGCVGLLIMQKNSQKTPEVSYNINGLPVLEINLENTTLEEVQSNSKELKYGGNSAFFYDGAEIYDFDDVSIKGRGNTTWGQLKKPYQIDLNKKTDLLGLGKRNKWVFLANYLDSSYLRNDTAFYLAKMVDEKYALGGEPIELLIDGENLGLYYLTPKIEIGKNSVDLRDEMGIVMELDNLNIARDGEPCYFSGEGNCLIVHDAVDENNTVLAAESFVATFSELETAALAGDYEKVQELIDVDSFAQYFLISEFSNNPDAYTTSWYMYKDGESDKIHAGPVWDFDLAFGSYAWGQWWVENGESPESDMTRRGEAFGVKNENGQTVVAEPNLTIARAMYYLMDIPEFKDTVKRIYQEKMAGRKSEILARINRRANEIYVAAQEDSAIWERGEFDEAVDYLYDWVARRYDYFDMVYGDGDLEKVVQEL